MSNPKKIDDFKSSFSDFLRPNLYAVYVFPKTGFYPQNDNKVGLLAHEATFPFFTFNTNDFWYNNLPMSAVSKVDYDPAAFTFYVDKDNVILGFLDAWTKQILGSDRTIGFYDDYVARVVVELFDRQFNTAAMVTLVDAYPVNVASLSLGYAQNDALMNVQVSLQFRDVEYDFFATPKQQARVVEAKAKSWKDYLTMENVRRGVNMVSKIKDYRRMIENGNVYDAVRNAGKVFTLGTKTTSGGYDDPTEAASRIFKSTKSAKGGTDAEKMIGNASRLFKK